MGTRQLAGQTHLEIGRRTGARDHLEDAARILEAIGATLDVTEARAALQLAEGDGHPRA
jgi:hypothetical protein